MNHLIKINQLSVRTQNGDILVEPISLSINAGQNLTILGETGSGKSLLAAAIMGALPEDMIIHGEIIIYDQILHSTPDKLDKNKFKKYWGRALAMLPQEPARSLDPTMNVINQVTEGLRFIKGLDKPTAQQQAKDNLDSLSLSCAIHHYPHELSGGMAQRASFAISTAGGAHIVIADEPTKGLDDTNKYKVTDMLTQITKVGGCLLTITHDIDVAKRLSTDNDIIMVMKKGKLLEQGRATAVLNNPQSDYARKLIQADPATWTKNKAIHTNTPLVSLDNIAISRGKKTLFSGLSATFYQGQTIGLIGDSGIGKSSLGDALCGLIRPSTGSITWHNTPARHQVLKLYQDPPAAFAPNIRLGTLIDDIIKRHHLNKNKLPPLMQALHLHPELLNRTSEHVSGGELQRIAIMRALLMEPLLLFADEVTSRLDPITQKTTLDLLTLACHEYNCTLIMVSHDHHLVQHYCDAIIDLTQYYS